MPTRIHPKKLLVEGDEDKRVIPELIEANGVTWGEKADDAIVFIKQFGGISNLLRLAVIEAELKESGVEIVGIMIDANNGEVTAFFNTRSNTAVLVSHSLKCCFSTSGNFPRRLLRSSRPRISDGDLTYGDNKF